MPAPWNGRLVFGEVLPCPRCHMTGKTRLPPMPKAEADQRRRENLIRATQRLDPLPRPPTWGACEVCDGSGVVPRGAVNADPVPWPE